LPPFVATVSGLNCKHCFDRLAVDPYSELFVRSDGMIQSGPDPVSENRRREPNRSKAGGNDFEKGERLFRGSAKENSPSLGGANWGRLWELCQGRPGTNSRTLKARPGSCPADTDF